jgi:hypothetical protein
MKKLVFLLFSLTSINSFSQLGGPKWSESGNAVSGTSFLGTTNAQNLNFRTNNILRFFISSSGDVVLPLLSSTANGFAILDFSGKIARINFSGSTSDVFFGNGTWGSLSSATGWFTSSGITFTNNKVGIGVTSPLQALECNGSAIFNGSVNASQFNAGDVISQGRELRIISGLCMKGFDATVPGSRSEVCGMGNDLYLQSNAFNNHTIFNFGNTGNVGIGTNTPAYKLDVFGSTRFSNDVFLGRIKPLQGDSIIHLGDSSLAWNTASHKIYANPYYYFDGFGTTFMGGISLGGAISGTDQSSARGKYAISIGYGNHSNGGKSIAIGNFVGVSGSYSHTQPDNKNIVIGSGISFTQKLTNSFANSLMIGFNSNIPTIFVSTSDGLNTTGNVGIGTTDIPDGYKLAVFGKVIAEEVVLLYKSDWPDFAFSPTYIRKNYLEKEAYYSKHKHLEFLLSASEIQENGVPIVKTVAGIVQNTEENSLDIIDLYKKFELMDKKIVSLKEENDQLKAELEGLKKLKK